MSEVVAEGNNSNIELGDNQSNTTIIPIQVSNNVDDLLFMFATVAANTPATVPTLTTPPGWTEHYTRQQNDLRVYFYYKQSTGGEIFPDITISAQNRWSVISGKVEDVDWVNGPFGDEADAGNNNQSDSFAPDITTLQDNSVILNFKGIERRYFVGDAINTRSRPTQLFVTSDGSTSQDEQSGTGNHDSHCALVKDYELDNGTLIDGVRFDTSGSGDNVRLTIEVRTNGNDVPLLFSNLITSSISGLSSGNASDNFRDAIMASGVLLDTPTIAETTFDASLADPVLNTLTIPGHGLTPTRVVQIIADTGTLPTGLTDTNYAFVRVVDPNTIQLVGANGDLDASSDWYTNGTNLKSEISITAAGFGTCKLRDCGLVWGEGGDNLARPPSGSSSLADGNYIGDSGWNQNHWGYGREFTAPRDMSNEVVTFFNNVSSGLFQEQSIWEVVFIDVNNEWVSYKTIDGDFDSGGSRRVQIEPGSTSVQALALNQSAGSFDASQVKFICWVSRGNNSQVARPSSSTQGMTFPTILNPIRVYGATSTNPADYQRLFETIIQYSTTVASKPSDLQLALEVSLEIGDGTNDVFFKDTEKSVAFPPLANGVESYQVYRENLGITLNATGTSEIDVGNNQIGATLPFDFLLNIDPTATINLEGLIIVQGTVLLDPDIDYMNINFVGGKGVTLNTSIVDRCIFQNIQRPDGYAIIGNDEPITNSQFRALNPTDFAIEITDAGTYNLTGTVFTGFNTVLNVTATTGTVTITIPPGDPAPTFVTAGATVVIDNSVVQTGTVTGIFVGSRIQIYNSTTNTEIYNDVPVSPTLAINYTEGVEISNGDTIRIRAAFTSGLTSKEDFETSLIATAAGFNALVQQSDDTKYINNAIDGSTVTECSGDFPNIEVDINDPDNILDGRRIYAFFKSQTNTADGIHDFFGEMMALNESTFLISGLRFDNKKVDGLKIVESLFIRQDGDIPIASGSGAIYFENDIAVAPVISGLANQILSTNVDTALGAAFPAGSAGDALDSALIVPSLQSRRS